MHPAYDGFHHIKLMMVGKFSLDIIAHGNCRPRTGKIGFNDVRDKTLKDVLHIPSLSVNLIYVSKMNDDYWTSSFDYMKMG